MLNNSGLTQPLRWRGLEPRQMHVICRDPWKNYVSPIILTQVATNRFCTFQTGFSSLSPPRRGDISIELLTICWINRQTDAVGFPSSRFYPLRSRRHLLYPNERRLGHRWCSSVKSDRTVVSVRDWRSIRVKANRCG